jgi:hypothetical protein
MESKVLSLRVCQARHAEILIECDSRKINCSEWLETQIAIAANHTKQMKNIEDEILKLMESYERNPEGVRWRFRALLRKVSG